ncbi:hypothetical protein [Erythrobacter donghaensis]|jgi:hypothetical protein|uniref:hypothetical protein n=1 Tax=Erythrobacter donghaensis TaxID=267135 RepID=UPI00093A576A|nr:hypothetical protein [Erythrobacter donghaensis]
MTKWYSIPTSLAISEAEYRANISGINIVFGAVLGFVLAKIEGLPPLDFMVVLITSAAAVVAILYLGSTEHRLFYGMLAGGTIALLPMVLERFGIPPIPKLQPTLIAWTIMVLVVEFSPRRPANTESEREEVPQ